MAGVTVTNPKRNGRGGIGRHAWYDLYAGYSASFALKLLASLPEADVGPVLDPWNGAGTTTAAAATLGFRAVGFDLNPAMVVASRAMLLPSSARSAAAALHRRIDRGQVNSVAELRSDPLGYWFTPAAVGWIRGVEHVLLGGRRETPGSSVDVERLSAIDAFAYLAVFRAVRQLLHGFYATNPTWLKKPKGQANRLRPSREAVQNLVAQELGWLLEGFDSYAGYPFSGSEHVAVARASSLNLPLADGAASYVLSSPPYCTRIDYAIATAAELAVLRCGEASGFGELRLSLIGSVRTPRHLPAVDSRWGNTCCQFLEKVRQHPSKASSTYYWRSHVDYFAKLYSSIAEIARVLRPGGAAFLVVQDSFYKEIHNDLQSCIVEMAGSAGLELVARVDFPTQRSMAMLKRRIQQDARRKRETESVLQLAKRAARH